MKKYILLLTMMSLIAGCSNESTTDTSNENEDSEEVTRLKEENEELKRQQEEQDNKDEQQKDENSQSESNSKVKNDSEDDSKAEDSNSEQDTESTDQGKNDTNEGYVAKILNQTDYHSTYPPANTSDTETYSMLIEEYIYRLAGFYSTGQRHAKDVFFYLEEGSEPYNTVIENQKSGNFDNYELDDVNVTSVLDIGDGNVIVETYRTYSHASTDGLQGSGVTYIMNKDSLKVLGWVETSNTKHDENDASDENIGTSEAESDDFSSEIKLVTDYTYALADYYNGTSDEVFDYIDQQAADRIVANKESGNFTNYEVSEPIISNLHESSNGNVIIVTVRDVSYDTSDGKIRVETQYEIANEDGNVKILNWK